MPDESAMPRDVQRYLQAVVAMARQGRTDQPLTPVWDATEEAAVVLLRSGQPAAEARRRLQELLRADPALRGALRRCVRERAGTAWPEPAPSLAHPACVQLDLFDPPADDPPADAPPAKDPPAKDRPEGLTLAAGSDGDAPGRLLGLDEPVADILQACIELASGRLDGWQRRALAPWLHDVDPPTLVRARIWAEIWLRDLTDAQP